MCLRKGFVSNVMLSTRLNAKQILAEVRNESDFGAKLRVWSRVFWMPGCAGKTVEGTVDFSYCVVNRLVCDVIMSAC